MALSQERVRPAPDWTVTVLDGPAPAVRVRTPFRHAARNDWTSMAAVALGLCAMVILPLVVVSLVPSGSAGTGGRTGKPAGVAVSMAPVTYEAEAPENILAGSASRSAYPDASGGQIVHGLGNYQKPEGPGALKFAVAVPAAGTYVLTFYYVHLNGEPLRTAIVSINDDPSFPVTVSGSAICCATASVNIKLRAGANTITFTNPESHAPSIDRIVLSTP